LLLTFWEQQAAERQSKDNVQGVSHVQLKKGTCPMLVENELVARDFESQIYRTTGKGIRFLETSRQFGGLLEVRGVEQNRIIQHV